MDVFCSLCILIAGVVSVEAAGECIVPDRYDRQPDYYWKDYNGVMPHDAITGGYSTLGNITYIGLSAFSDIPGILLHDINERLHNRTYTLILCSGRKNQFLWKPTTVDAMHLLTDFNFVKGGIEENTLLYVGRASFEGRVQIGRVYPHPHKWEGIWFFKASGGPQQKFTSFELLVSPRLHYPYN